MFSTFHCLKYVFLALQIDTLLACGGLSKNPLFLQEHVDIVGLSLSLSHMHTLFPYTQLSSLLPMGDICFTVLEIYCLFSVFFSSLDILVLHQTGSYSQTVSSVYSTGVKYFYHYIIAVQSATKA